MLLVLHYKRQISSYRQEMILLKRHYYKTIVSFECTKMFSSNSFELGQSHVYTVIRLEYYSTHWMSNDRNLSFLANVDLIVGEHFYQADLHLIHGKSRSCGRNEKQSIDARNSVTGD